MEKAPQLSLDQEKPDGRHSVDRRIGESAMANVSYGQEINYDNSGIFTIENARDYFKDRSTENIDMLERVGDAHTLRLYKNLMYRYPQLRNIKLINDEKQKDNAYFSCATQGKNSFCPSIGYNFSNKSTYIFTDEQKIEEKMPSCDDKLGRKVRAKRLAFLAGADWKKCIRNQNLMADGVLLHEFGHGYDFIENYFRPQYNALASSSNRGLAALYRARELNIANRTEYSLQSPSGAFGFLKRGSEEWRKSELRLRAMGINNYEEYIYAVYQSYRDQPDEAFADNFANNYILLYYNDYFTSNPRDREKVYTTGETKIQLDRDFVHFMGLKQGVGLEIDKLNRNRKSIDHFTGFLASNMYVGKQLYLYENGDPKNPGRKWGGFGTGSQISEITLEPTRDKKTGKIHHYVFFKTANGDEYHISRTKKEPEIVYCSPKELSQDLGLKVGDKVQLIDHIAVDARRMDFSKVKKRDENIKVIEGEIEHISGDKTWHNVTISYRDIYDATRQHHLSLPVKRQWRRFYVGNYEILPLPN